MAVRRGCKTTGAAINQVAIKVTTAGAIGAGSAGATVVGIATGVTITPTLASLIGIAGIGSIAGVTYFRLKEIYADNKTRILRIEELDKENYLPRQCIDISIAGEGVIEADLRGLSNMGESQQSW